MNFYRISYKIDIDSEVDVCSLPVMTGTCNQEIEKWYFDTNSRTCKRFKFSGCNGNHNNFHSREQCESNCGSITIDITDSSNEGN